MEKIQKLLSEGRYFDLIQEVETELKKSFNISSIEERQVFDELNQLKNKALDSIFEMANNDKEFKVDNLRSFTSSGDNEQSTHVKIKLKEGNKKLDESFIKAFDQISIINNKDTNNFQSFIYLINSTTIPNILKDEGINVNMFKNFPPGNFFQGIKDNDTPIYIIFDNSEGNENKIDKLLVALRKVIITIYEQESKNNLFKIILTDSNNTEQLKIYFYLIVFQLIYWISIYNTSELKPLFSFLFDTIQEQNLFEKTVIRLNQPEEKILSPSKTLDEQLESLSKKVLTNDNNYKQQLRSVLSVINEDDIPILLLGETGVGKSWLANIIHNESDRHNKNYEEQNCGNLSGDKLDQKLFGWKKGAFTGAIKDYDGKIKRAEGGTLFLDEIDRTTKETRDGLITFIGTKKFEVLGEGKSTQANVRLIFGSNKDLKKLFKRGNLKTIFIIESREE